MRQEPGAAVVLQARKTILALEERLGHVPTAIKWVLIHWSCKDDF